MKRNENEDEYEERERKQAGKKSEDKKTKTANHSSCAVYARLVYRIYIIEMQITNVS